MKLRSQESTHWLDIDPVTGLVVELGLENLVKSPFDRIETTLSIEYGGHEKRAATGGLEYVGTEHSDKVLMTGEPRFESTNHGIQWSVPVRIGEIPAEINYLFNTHGPAISIQCTLMKSNFVVRNLKFNLQTSLAGHGWILNIPGNGLRSDVPLELVSEAIGISPLGGLRGSAALVHLAQGKSTKIGRAHV